MSTRPTINDLGLSAGKKARLFRILYQHGLRNGTALFLPYDQDLEHGPRDFFANPAAGDPGYIARLAVVGGFNGIAIQIGLAEKFFWDFAGEVPLILKLNGKTEIPPDDEALSPVHATVEDAVRLGGDAVGYTLYVGTPAQAADFEQYRQVREDARRLGMPLIVWAYPRGSAIEAKGGRDSFYAVDCAARTASELGADMVKVNFPHPEKRAGVPAQYDQAGWSSAATSGSDSTTSRCGSSNSSTRSWPSARARASKAFRVATARSGKTRESPAEAGQLGVGARAVQDGRESGWFS